MRDGLSVAERGSCAARTDMLAMPVQRRCGRIATFFVRYFGAAPVDFGRVFTARSPIFWPIAAPTSVEFR